ncbi:hypothetical protein ACFQE1_03645 [Halobium palmae]|uniref:Domain of unknown function domain-containing protein n=1 Tax=Halobium palmae TaxID=1776492 RepID=A0ABD5RW85_9EURY
MADRDVEEPVDFEKSRGKGFLTASDKDWLDDRDDEGLSDDAIRKRRERVRDRCRNAIHDFRLVWEGFSDEDLRQVFDFRTRGPGRRATAFEYAMFHEGVIDTLAVLYKGFGREEFVDKLERAVARVEANGRDSTRKAEEMQDVSVSITSAVNINLDELAEKLEETPAEELSNAEISALFKILHITGEPMPTDKKGLIELFEEHWGDLIGVPPESLLEPPKDQDSDGDELTQEEISEALKRANMKMSETDTE